MTIEINTTYESPRTKEDVLRAILHDLAYVPILKGTIKGTVDVLDETIGYTAVC